MATAAAYGLPVEMGEEDELAPLLDLNRKPAYCTPAAR